MFDYSAVYLWCSIAFCRKINCSPFLLNKPLVNITETAGEFFFHNPVKSFHGRDPDAGGWVQVFDGAGAPALDASSPGPAQSVQVRAWRPRGLGAAC